jgi:hypothetical protein
VAPQEARTWHSNTISSATQAALVSLRDSSILEGFYLAGGTALSLQMGHRISLDLDFFARDHFNEDALVQRVQVLSGFALAAKAPFTIHATIEGIKVSFLGYAYPILFPTDTFLDVSVADPRDIACMKVSAISSRGAKRDFVDLYVCAKQFGLDEILRLFGNKYAQTRWSRTHILKSLTYFAGAEKDPMPRMLAPVDWSEVKQFFLREAPRLMH